MQKKKPKSDSPSSPEEESKNCKTIESVPRYDLYLKRFSVFLPSSKN
jgi:hypothetical protein